jgi:hypothetical protein
LEVSAADRAVGGEPAADFDARINDGKNTEKT